VRGRREHYASPAEAEALIAAAPDRDRAIWATAVYAGPRRGELQALRAEDIDLAGGVVCVERSWDERIGEIEPKSAAGQRRVPITPVLRDVLAAHRIGTGRVGTDLAFGRTINDPFHAQSVQSRADTAWRAAGLERLTLHECRHTYASLMIAAGVNAKALSTFMAMRPSRSPSTATAT
jgi:integrase